MNCGWLGLNGLEGISGAEHGVFVWGGGSKKYYWTRMKYRIRYGYRLSDGSVIRNEVWLHAPLSAHTG